MEIRDLLCEGECLYEFVCDGLYWKGVFIGPDMEDWTKMDVSGALEDTLHRMVDNGWTDEQMYESSMFSKDADDTCEPAYYVDLGYTIPTMICGITKTDIRYQEPCGTYKLLTNTNTVRENGKWKVLSSKETCRDILIKESATDDDILEGLIERNFLRMSLEEVYLTGNMTGDMEKMVVCSAYDNQPLMELLRI